MTAGRRFNWVRFLLLLYPALEVIAFIAVVQLLGWFWALLLLAGGFVVGVLVMRLAGATAFQALTNADAQLRGVDVEGPDGTTQRVQQQPSAAAMAQTRHQIGASAMLFLAGILLAVPGFISDLIGLVLLIPGVRGRAGSAWGKRMQERAARAQVTVIQGETMPDGTSTWRTTTMSPGGYDEPRTRTSTTRRDPSTPPAQLPPATGAVSRDEVVEGDVVNRPGPTESESRDD